MNNKKTQLPFIFFSAQLKYFSVVCLVLVFNSRVDMTDSNGLRVK